MSLLDDLARNSCIVDFSIDELAPAISVEMIPSEASEKSETRSNRSSYDLVSSRVLSPQKIQPTSAMRGLEEMSWVG